jgi:hypothetical protein
LGCIAFLAGGIARDDDAAFAGAFTADWGAAPDLTAGGLEVALAAAGALLAAGALEATVSLPGADFLLVAMVGSSLDRAEHRFCISHLSIAPTL